MKLDSQTLLEQSASLQVLVLDVRDLASFERGHIPNAIHLPFSKLEAQIASLCPNQQQTLVVYCAAGTKSAMAQKLLINLGYQTVINFGGIANFAGELVVKTD
ncbi:MAG: rhodanese-like domain-containing protein [Erysipelotrichaceae bacterium]